jgi:hypothetical protein
MSNYRIRNGFITNNLKCQFGMHLCDGFIEKIEMDISLAYFGVRMKTIGKGQDC